MTFVKIWIGLIIFAACILNLIYCFLYDAEEEVINGKIKYKLTWKYQPWVSTFYGEFLHNFILVCILFIPYVILTIFVFMSLFSVSCWYSKYQQVIKHKPNQQSPARIPVLNYVDWNRNVSDMRLTRATFVIVIWFFLVQTVCVINYVISKGHIQLPTDHTGRLALLYFKQLFISLIYVCKPIVYLCLNSKYRSKFVNPCAPGDEEDQLLTGPVGQGLAAVLSQGVPSGTTSSAPVSPAHRAYTPKNANDSPGSAPGSPRQKGYVARHAYLYNQRKTQSAPNSPVVPRAKSFVA